MRRREFITLVGGAASAWSFPARSQQGSRVRRIGVLMYCREDDPDGKARLAAFRESLRQLGRIEDANIRIDVRWGAGDLDLYRKFSSELVSRRPDIVLGTDTPSVAILKQADQNIPIVFVQITDPIGGGLVKSLSHPGGNVTGFTLFEYGTSAKWLELLKSIAPNTKRVAVLGDTTNTGSIGQYGAIQGAAPVIGFELIPMDLRDIGDIDRDIAEFAQRGNGGIIVLATSSALVHRKLIISLAARHRLPSVHSARSFAQDGGLIAYGPDRIDQYRRAAGYVDRILKGEKPADLPVQNPTKYDLTINLKAAKALGLTVPTTLLATADEVIE